MEIARKVTSELSEGEITRLSEVINEALYRNEEPLDDVKKMYFSDEAHNHILVDNDQSIGICQSINLRETHCLFLRVGAVDVKYKNMGLISASINEHSNEARYYFDYDFTAVCSGNPYVINLFYKKNFLLPTKMGNKSSMLLKKSKEILREIHNDDFGLNDMFIIPAGKYPYPGLRNNEPAYDKEVIEFIRRFMITNDRLFMIKEANP